MVPKTLGGDKDDSNEISLFLAADSMSESKVREVITLNIETCLKPKCECGFASPQNLHAIRLIARA